VKLNYGRIEYDGDAAEHGGLAGSGS
jgi:hypothetical protein